MQKKKRPEILYFNPRQPVSQAEAAERSETLRRTSSFLNMVIENIPAMVAVKDARDLRFVLVNRHSEELTGVLRQDALGKNDFDLFPKEQAEFFVARDREVLASGKAQVIPRRADHHATQRHPHSAYDQDACLGRRWPAAIFARNVSRTSPTKSAQKKPWLRARGAGSLPLKIPAKVYGKQISSTTQSITHQCGRECGASMSTKRSIAMSSLG